LTKNRQNGKRTADLQVQATFRAGAIFIKEGTPQFENLRIKSEAGAPGWRLVKNLDGPSLSRKVRDAGLNFFSTGGAITAIGFGFSAPETVDRTVQRMLARRNSERFNSLEITQLAVKLFWRVAYVSVSAQARHIQESAFLFRDNDLSEGARARLAAST